MFYFFFFFFSSRRRHTRLTCDWSSDVCSSDLAVDEVRELVRSHSGPISIGGGRFSMGGQIATEGSLFLDMRGMKRVVAFSPENRTISVEPGITWRAIQELIDPHGLSVKIMQSYASFTVGGSLSVNVHG